MLVSAIYQHESSHMSQTSWTSFPPPTPSCRSRLSQSTRFELPASYNRFPWAVLILHMVRYMFQCYSLLLSHCLLPAVSIRLLSVCIATAALQKSSYYSLSQELFRCLIYIISNHHRKESKYYWSPFYRRKIFDASKQERWEQTHVSLATKLILFPQC